MSGFFSDLWQLVKDALFGRTKRHLDAAEQVRDSAFAMMDKMGVRMEHLEQQNDEQRVQLDETRAQLDEAKTMLKEAIDKIDDMRDKVETFRNDAYHLYCLRCIKTDCENRIPTVKESELTNPYKEVKTEC